ncbi:Diphthamide biosynthesis protein 1 [Brettanomyces nanus]|uniref:2-(3-amino-3-carboxypropyl)histidine synthase subunit 1 n=1 Tax=Eeniella nana TaxID=13502 RepID=A0A875S0N9_EENNA|nr:Diphthamide biosynthesis protein 1 [Brettanomyces nanus]QPG74966.1 Diphthamide biosynthesis protein 1 [Brettanomyces nanus]
MSSEEVKNHRRRFAGSRKMPVNGDKIGTNGSKKTVAIKGRSKVIGRIMNQIPKDILEDEELNEVIKLLPSNYNFEIHKTVWNIRKKNAVRVCLQMPEGLLNYSLIIADILEQFCHCEVLVMGDVTYGACCIDDYTARALDCDFIVHYGHSCLVPIAVTTIKVLYIFVTIQIDEQHLINTIRRNFNQGTRLAVFGTIQFNPAIHSLKVALENPESPQDKLIYVIAPQIMPLSKGEVLGCTSPSLDPKQFDAMVYVGDGRFHLESAMIHNPHILAYRYDPYSRKFTKEGYDQKEMISVRREAVQTAKGAKKIGLVLGALGRQGNPITVEKLEKELRKHGKIVVKIILSEIFPKKMAMFDDIGAFVQVACPRLSIDWGYAFSKPLLTPYEAMVMLEEDTPFTEEFYPMDYYYKEGYGRGKKPART